MQHDGHRPEDVLKVEADEHGGDDEAADTLRYMVATKSKVIVQTKLRAL